jgi:spoIIIJ-associated protein
LSRPNSSGRHALEGFVRDWLDVAGGRLGLGVTAEITRRREDVLVTLKSDGRGFGQRRPVQIASALQTLLEAAMARQGYREGVEVRLAEESAEGQQESHGLMSAIRAVAAKAAQQGRSFALGPMSVGDRKQVHQALSDLGQVWTQSEGDGIFRRLWIVPRTMVSGRSSHGASQPAASSHGTPAPGEHAHPSQAHGAHPHAKPNGGSESSGETS